MEPIICCCQVQDYIYWIISTENDHRHYHKFIKYEKRLRKEGKNMLGLPIQQNLCHFSASLTFYVNPSWACALFRNNKHVVLGQKRKCQRVKESGLLTDSERKMNRSEVSPKWNKCRIYVEKRRKKHARFTYPAKSLPLQREFGRVALPWVKRPYLRGKQTRILTSMLQHPGYWHKNR
jgi:hypothetical protein